MGRFGSLVTEKKLIISLLLIYFLISVIKIEHPGVHNDQLMFVNAATFRPDNIFLWKSFNGVPTMVFPYIGALKSYIYMPIFFLFGVNIYSIRIPQIILMGIALFILYKALKIGFNRKIAFLSVLFLALDPSLIAHSRVDAGPVVLEFLLKAVSVYLLFQFIKSLKLIYYLMIIPVMGLGIFNKLNFLWFVNAFFISFAIVYGRRFYINWKNKLYPVLLFFIPYLILLRFALKISKEVTANYKDYANEISINFIASNFGIVFGYLKELISGEQFFKMVYGYSPTVFGEVFSSIFLLILITGIGYFYINKKNHNLGISFFVLVLLLILLQVLLTKRATNPWHAFSVYPFLTVLFAVVLINIADFSKKRITLAWGVAILVVVYQLYVNLVYILEYSKPTKLVSYSSSIYELVNFAGVRPEHFICIDVDICNQLLSLTQKSYKFYEPFAFLDDSSYQKTLASLDGKLKSEGVMVVGHGESASHFPKVRKSFFKYAFEHGININKVWEVKDGNRVIFEVYKPNLHSVQ